MNRWTPTPWMLEACRWLISRPFAGLFFDLGMRKTSIALATLETLKKAANGQLRVLLIAPIRVLYTTWPDEIAKWGFDLYYANLHINREWLYQYDANIYGINPESALVLLQDPRFLAEQFDVLIIDESHKFKAHDTRRFKLLKPHLPRFGKRWILTGTPSPNSLIDLWAQIYILDLGNALGRFITHFRNAFCLPDWTGYGYTLQPGAEEEIYRRIAPMILRMEAQGNIDMPPIVYNHIPVELDKKTKAMYREMEETFLLAIGDDIVMSPNAAAAGIRCRQIANGGLHIPIGGGKTRTELIHHHKDEALAELIEDLVGNQTLVFYEFTHDRDRMEKVLGSAAHPPTPANIKLFMEGKIQILLGHPASMAEGLNLQEHCNTVIWYGIPWDLAAYDQAIGRVWRSGQKNRVMVHHIVAKDTLDETVLEVLQAKSKSQKKLLDAMKGARAH